MFTREEYLKLESGQSKHRFFNSILLGTLCLSLLVVSKQIIYPMYERMSGIEAQRVEKQEIGNIMNDESVRTCRYTDSLGHATIGVGHLVTKSDTFGNCITTHEAIALLQKDYRYAKSNVEKRYPWAEGEVKLVLINMTFQLGESRLAGFKKTLQYLEEGDYTKASGELLDSEMFLQTPSRLVRHAARILTLTEV